MVPAVVSGKTLSSRPRALGESCMVESESMVSNESCLVGWMNTHLSKFCVDFFFLFP